MLVFYVAMIAIALGATYDWLVSGGRGMLIKASGFLALLAAYLVWNDGRKSVPMSLTIGRVLVFFGLAITAFLGAGLTLYSATYELGSSAPDN
ncbi:hypothetical protein JQ633_19185 [Bradyrhizobium tropiciagri]|uniref:hypothetical protein n=1 Tax=Bradyrhizobium tropiciagri TaxID=312253 RepID=UPI001BAA1359|nr:hypothetical protein [Bradyrhizobium tropiciagri]MBR0872493.1 hypothetical protein [Bradyrhizobium tropiciagri]